MQDDYTAFWNQNSEMKTKWLAVVDEIQALENRTGLLLWVDRDIWQNSVSGKPFSRPLTDDEFEAMIASTFNYAAEAAANQGAIALANKLFNR